MHSNSILNELISIADTLNEKLATVRASGDFQTADELADTLKRLESYIAEKEKASKACNP